MALSKRALVLVSMITFFLCGLCDGAVHKVGDSAGWTTMGGVDYLKWASNRTFVVGDTLVFEYNKQFHNVIRVSHQDFRSCNATSPITTYASGSDSIAIERTGHLYFICGIPGHCQQGQKVDIRVPRASLGPNPSPMPSPTASPAGPILSGSALLICSKLWLVLGLLAAFLCSAASV